MGVFGNIELAKLNIPQDHKSYKYIKNTTQALEKATHLTKQLLTFAKGGDPLLSVVHVQQIVKASINFNLTGSNVKAHYCLPDDLWQVKVDKAQIDQVIANLTINAKQAMPDGGNLYIDAENIKDPKDPKENTTWHLSGDFIKLSIKDEGLGISAKYVDRIFDPYFSTKQAGSGLGLAMAHSIITKHSGYICVDSLPDVGTTFTLYLPAKKSFQKQPVAISTNMTEKQIDTSGHILIMDDEELIRNVLSNMLKSCGYTVDSAVNGKDAIEKYIDAGKNGNPFDIVIMDLTIPGGMGGKEAISKLLAIDKKVNVIVSSGYSTDPVMAKYRDYGFKSRLVKPFEMEDLKKELSCIMEME